MLKNTTMGQHAVLSDKSMPVTYQSAGEGKSGGKIIPVLLQCTLSCYIVSLKSCSHLQNHTFPIVLLRNTVCRFPGLNRHVSAINWPCVTCCPYLSAIFRWFAQHILFEREVWRLYLALQMRGMHSTHFPQTYLIAASLSWWPGLMVTRWPKELSSSLVLKLCCNCLVEQPTAVVAPVYHPPK